jgi:hypothetical protein
VIWTRRQFLQVLGLGTAAATVGFVPLDRGLRMLEERRPDRRPLTFGDATIYELRALARREPHDDRPMSLRLARPDGAPLLDASLHPRSNFLWRASPSGMISVGPGVLNDSTHDLAVSLYMVRADGRGFLVKWTDAGQLRFLPLEV